MCYLVREQQAAADLGRSAPAPGPGLARPPRWVPIAALALVGSLAFAAYVDLRSPPEAPQATEPAAAAAQPVALRTSMEGAQGSLPADDGVPTPADLLKAGASPCHHGL